MDLLPRPPNIQDEWMFSLLVMEKGMTAITGTAAIVTVEADIKTSRVILEIILVSVLERENGHI